MNEILQRVLEQLENLESVKHLEEVKVAADARIKTLEAKAIAEWRATRGGTEQIGISP